MLHLLEKLTSRDLGEILMFWLATMIHKEYLYKCKIVVWEHVHGVFLLIPNIFDVCLQLEVV